MNEIRQIRIHWQGGEPLLLGYEYWQKVLALAAESADKSRIQLMQSMQTNLTLYHSKYKELIQTYLSGTLGTSFELSSFRCFADEKADSFKKRWEAAYQQASDDGLAVGVLALLDDNATAQGAIKYIDRLKNEYGIRRLRFTLPFKQQGKNGRGFWLDAQKAGEFLSDAYRIWDRSGGDAWMELRPFAHLKARMKGSVRGPSGLCIFAKNCTEISLAVLPNGDVTLCDNFTHPQSDQTYGNIFHESLESILRGPKYHEMRKAVLFSLPPQCDTCRYLPFCFGGCFVRSYPIGESTCFHYCETYYRLFQAIDDCSE
jgi:uncharacterized protein